MATQLNFSWTPAGGNSITQDVEYQRDIDAIWSEAVQGLGPAIATYLLNGAFEDNRVYLSRIVNNCSGGAKFYSPVMGMIKITCPVVTLTKSNNTITVGFAHLGGSISQYIIKLYDSTGTNLLGSITVNGTIPDNISEMFQSLVSNTTYQVRVEVYAGIYSKKDCALQAVTTLASSGCATPTITGATIS